MPRPKSIGFFSECLSALAIAGFVSCVPKGVGNDSGSGAGLSEISMNMPPKNEFAPGRTDLQNLIRHFRLELAPSAGAPADCARQPDVRDYTSSTLDTKVLTKCSYNVRVGIGVANTPSPSAQPVQPTPTGNITASSSPQGVPDTFVAYYEGATALNTEKMRSTPAGQKVNVEVRVMLTDAGRLAGFQVADQAITTGSTNVGISVGIGSPTPSATVSPSSTSTPTPTPSAANDVLTLAQLPAEIKNFEYGKPSRLVFNRIITVKGLPGFNSFYETAITKLKFSEYKGFVLDATGNKMAATIECRSDKVFREFHEDTLKPSGRIKVTGTVSQVSAGLSTVTLVDCSAVMDTTN